MGFRPTSMRMRMSVWFTLGVIGIMVGFTLATLYHLREELIHEKSTIEHPMQPDYVLHGSMSDPEVAEIMRDLLIKTAYTAGPILLLVIALGWFLAGRSLRPIVELNKQLATVRPQDLHADYLVLEEGDREFREHLENLNSLLGRLGKSFDDLGEYAAKVAHELRTPLTILRLKVETSAEEIAPELCESLLVELERLSHVVDQSLLIAKAERGSLDWQSMEFDLAAILNTLVEDFRLLAAEEDRELVCDSGKTCPVETDRRWVKQILQGFLTNALKHGGGKIRVELSQLNGSARIVIENDIKGAKIRDDSNLGLGLRVVEALVGSQKRVAASAAKAGDVFRAEISIPTGR